jgi:hypothetical protein
MYAKNIIAFVMGILITITVLGQNSAQDSKEKATKAAETWLSLLDEGEYAESWESSSGLAKNAVSRDQWVQSMESAKMTFGNLIERTLKSREYATSLPGAPDGHYVIIQYETSFEKKKSAVETVTPMLDADGQWRVSGYHIR